MMPKEILQECTERIATWAWYNTTASQKDKDTGNVMCQAG